MHFEILVEDLSGKKALDILVPKIIGSAHTFKVRLYGLIGRIPKKLKPNSDAKKIVFDKELLQNLRAYGKTFINYPTDYPATVILVCDLDTRCLKELRSQLFALLNECDPVPETRFCIAVEEGEAWFLGDLKAVKTAYPDAKSAGLETYENDSICGTWEKLFDAVVRGGLKKEHLDGPYSVIGTHKSEWAEKIAPQMDVDNNMSPSFCYFRDKLRELAGTN